MEAFLVLSARHRGLNRSAVEVVPYQVVRPYVTASFLFLPAGQSRVLNSRHNRLAQLVGLDVDPGSPGVGSFAVHRLAFAGSPWRASGRNRLRTVRELGLCLSLFSHQYPRSPSCQESAAPRRDLSSVVCLGRSGTDCRRILAVPEISQAGRAAVSDGSLDRS